MVPTYSTHSTQHTQHTAHTSTQHTFREKPKVKAKDQQPVTRALHFALHFRSTTGTVLLLSSHTTLNFPLPRPSPDTNIFQCRLPKPSKMSSMSSKCLPNGFEMSFPLDFDRKLLLNTQTTFLLKGQTTRTFAT